MAASGKKAPVHQQKIVGPQAANEVSQGGVFGEKAADEFEIDAVSGQHGAQGNQAALGCFAFALFRAGPREEFDQRRDVGDIDFGAVDGQQAQTFPTHGGTETFFISRREHAPQPAPEAQGKFFTGQAERFFGDALGSQLEAGEQEPAPSERQTLCHGRRLDGHRAHQPENVFGRQQPNADG